jgi:Flp pilus assembly protein TadG
MRGLLRRLARDTGAASLVEFGLALPIVFFMGAGGIEYANLGRSQLMVSQIALNLADNASRVGMMTNLSITQLREADLNDVLQAARLQGQGIELTTHGRVTLSSLENVQQSYDWFGPVQRIHWQRCIGRKSGSGWDSTYGTTSTSAATTSSLGHAGTTALTGMGDTGYKVAAPSGSAVMFVEINYQYQPMFGSMFITARNIHHTASFIVRDKRDFSQLYNPSPAATASTCNLHNS